MAGNELGMTAFGSVSMTTLPTGAEVCHCPPDRPDNDGSAGSMKNGQSCEFFHGMQVTVCEGAAYPLQITWKVGGQAQGQILLSDAGCIAAWGQDSDWLAGNVDSLFL